MTNFCSDNVTGAAPEVIEAMVRANQDAAMPYGNDELTTGVTTRLSEIFECPVDVFLVATGTAANSLALSSMAPPYGGIYCHQDAHIQHHECGAPEFYSGGAKLVPLIGEAGKMLPGELETALKNASADVHYSQPAAISVSQASEVGRVYSAAEIVALCSVAKAAGLGTHMDGARFANAIAATGSTPAEMTWRAGIDVLSLGATKNGAIGAEAIVIFNPELAKGFGYRRKRGGHLFSKMRFVSAQFDAWLADSNWLNWASHANEMAQRLGAGLTTRANAALDHPADANILFASLPAATADALNSAGFEFYRMDDNDPVRIRLVTAFNNDPAEIDRFIEVAAAATA